MLGARLKFKIEQITIQKGFEKIIEMEGAKTINKSKQGQPTTRGAVGPGPQGRGRGRGKSLPREGEEGVGGKTEGSHL